MNIVYGGVVLLPIPILVDMRLLVLIDVLANEVVCHCWRGCAAALQNFIVAIKIPDMRVRFFAKRGHGWRPSAAVATLLLLLAAAIVGGHAVASSSSSVRENSTSSSSSSSSSPVRHRTTRGGGGHHPYSWLTNAISGVPTLIDRSIDPGRRLGSAVVKAEEFQLDGNRHHRSLGFGDYADHSFQCPVTTTCPLFCMADAGDCPDDCPDGYERCNDGTCADPAAGEACDPDVAGNGNRTIN